MSNYLIRWKSRGNSKSYVNVLSPRELKEWAHDTAKFTGSILRSNASVKECVKFLDSHNVYVIASIHRGALTHRKDSNV